MRARLVAAALLAAIAFVFQSACASTSTSTTAPDAPKCQVAVDSNTVSAPANGAAGAVNVTTTRDCTWAAASNAAWLTITSAATGQGSGTVTYRVDANAQPTVRQGVLAINGMSVTVSQDAAPCKFIVSPLNAAVSASAATISIDLQTLTGCKWNADTDEPWLHVMSASSGDGAASVRTSVDANSGAARTGHIRIADQAVTIQQAEVAVTPAPTPAPSPAPVPPPAPPPPTPPQPAPSPPAPPPPSPTCTYAISPTQQSIAASGGSGSIAVTSGSGCAWIATTHDAWLTVTNGASGSGNGTVGFSVAANSGGPRNGTVMIADQHFTVSQAAAQPCVYAISPTQQSVDANGGSGSIAVTSGSGCAWSAKSNAPWITITNGASGSANGSVGFSVAQNNGGGRSGSLTVAGQSFVVTQSGSTEH